MTGTRISSVFSLAQVREENIHLDEEFPLFVKHLVVEEARKTDPPAYHPYLELSIRLKGSGKVFIAGEEFPQEPCDVLLSGIYQPHWGTSEHYPMEYVTIYFLPNVMCDWGSWDESLSILNRFSASQPARNHLVRPSPELRERLVKGFQEMVAEFDERNFGRRFKLQATLIGMLVDLLRWEKEEGHVVPENTSSPEDWKKVMMAIRYIRKHFSEPVHATDVAAALGVSETRLRKIFRDTLKMPWTKYRQGYRIHRAVLLISDPGRNITQVALETGFTSLSHFNRTFKTFTGISPSQQLSKIREK